MERLPRSLRLKFADNPMVRKLVSNTGWLLVDRLLRLGGGLLVGVWLARYLGPEQFGLLNFAIAFVGIFSSLSSLGLDGIVVRDLVRYPEQRQETLGTTFSLKFLGGLLIIALSVGAMMLYRPQDPLSHWLVGITAAGTVFQAFDTIDFWFQSQVQSKYTIYAKNASFLGLLVLKALLIQNQAPLIAFAWVGMADVALGGVGLIVSYWQQGYSLKAWRFSAQRARVLLSDSWSVMLSRIAIFVQARIDQVMIGAMLGDAELGQYSVAMRLIEVFSFIPVVIYSSAAPVITEAKEQGEVLYYDRLLQLYRLMMLCFLLTAVPIFLFANPIVTLLYGQKYHAAGGLLALFSIRLLFANLGMAKTLFITNENLFRYSLGTSTVGALTNLSLNYLLLPHYGAAGAIWAMIISFSVTIFGVDLFYPALQKNLRTMLKAMVSPWKFTLL